MSIYTEKAVALFREGYNCAQAVTGAFAEPFGMSQEDALRFSEGMGAGMGRLRLTCGSGFRNGTAGRVKAEQWKTE